MQYFLLIIFSLILFGCNTEKKYEVKETNEFSYTSNNDSLKSNMEELPILTLFDFFNNGYLVLDSSTGDLNKDNYLDLVAILKHKDSTNSERLVVIFLFDSEKNDLIKSSLSYKLILPPREHIDFDGYDNIKIKNGTLIVSQSLTIGWIKTIFRFQEEQWSLIGFNGSIPDYEYFYDIDYNLNTGNLYVDKTKIGTDTIAEIISDNITIRPLPNFENYEPKSMKIKLKDGTYIYI
jgi:hypothetical protein